METPRDCAKGYSARLCLQGAEDGADTSGCCAAVRGTIIPGIAVRPIATGTNQTTRTTTSVSGLCGCRPHSSQPEVRHSAQSGANGRTMRLRPGRCRARAGRRIQFRSGDGGDAIRKAQQAPAGRVGAAKDLAGAERPAGACSTAKQAKTRSPGGYEPERQQATGRDLTMNRPLQNPMVFWLRSMAFALWAGLASAAPGAERHALIMGNNSYPQLPERYRVLRGCEADTALMRQILTDAATPGRGCAASSSSRRTRRGGRFTWTSTWRRS